MAPRVARALAAVGLAGFEGRDPTTLSGGEKQRLAIAGLLALRPPVMVLDEPTTDLDPAGRAEVLAVLGALRHEGLALLVIEHDTAAAAAADQLLLLREGRVVAHGPPSAVLADVAACARAGVRPPDVSRVFAALGVAEPPLDVDAAAERLRAAGLVPVAPSAPAGAPPKRPVLLEVEGLGHRYADGRAALDSVSLTIRRGEFLALIGRNGSGKTTLAKHLNGLLAPTTGTVHLEGRPLASFPLEQLAQRVGYVFQDPDHQLFAPTVADEVAFGPRNVGLAAAEIEARVTEALAAVGLEDRTADPFLLDKGARQRLAVAAVLALRPDVLVLDEPTTGLDHPEQQRMLGLLTRLHAGGRTVVIITHTPWVIAEHAERVVLLAGGRLHYDGPLRPFFADEALVRAAAFRPPEVTQLGRRLGCTPLSVDELVAWMPGRAPACP
jgi:energy-coupling factor transport system ATP-binding protein